MLRIRATIGGALWLAAGLLHAQPPGELGVPLNRLRRFMPAEFDLLSPTPFKITELSPAVYLDEVGGDARGHVSRIDHFLKDGQWSEAVEMLMRLNESQVNKLIRSASAEASYPRYVTVAKYVKERLGALGNGARPVLEEYRDRIDPIARQWFEQGIRDNDAQLIARVANELSHSSYGDRAAMALGELSLEAGRHEQARRYWQSIHPGLQWHRNTIALPYWQRAIRGEDIGELRRDLLAQDPTPYAFRDSNIPIQDVWARLTLTSILEGNLPRATAELQILRELWANASGTLAGREANYAAALEQLLAGSHHWPQPKSVQDWKTFAGTTSRNRELDATIEIALHPDWSTPLHPVPAADKQVARAHKLPVERAGETAAQPCSHFPIVVDKLVLIQDENSLRCLDLETGKPAWSGSNTGVFYSAATSETNGHSRFDTYTNRPSPLLGPRRFTLSAHGTTLVATLGSQNDVGRHANSVLLGFDLEAEGAIRFGPVELDANWTFQGAPLCDDHWCWVALRERNATAQDYVACYDMRSGTEVWRTRICSAETIGHGLIDEATNQLLTRHEDTIYFSTNLGAIVALSVSDGSIRWLTKYPRTGPERENLLDEPWYALRDMLPCLYHEGMIIAAPADCQRILALEANTGSLLWQMDVARDATQLLGVGDSQLVVSGRRLWWIDVYTGRLSDRPPVNPYPAGQFAKPTGFGRGLLAGGYIYWPTGGRSPELHVLSQRTGRIARQPLNLEFAGASAGNLVWTQTHLLIASPARLYAFSIE